MTARAFAYEYAFIGRAPAGEILLQARALVADDADATVNAVVAPVVQLPVASPATWQNDIRAAVQVAAAALSPPVSIALGQVSLLAF